MNEYKRFSLYLMVAFHGLSKTLIENGETLCLTSSKGVPEFNNFSIP